MLHSKDSDREEDKKFLEPIVYMSQVPGKGLSKVLARAFNHWLSIPQDKLVLIEEITQSIHNCGLLVDDIQDQSLVRRGIPAAHTISGIGRTITAAHLVTFTCIEKLLALEKLELIRVFNEQLLELVRGDAMELYWRDNFICPTEKEYTMTMRKTGGLFNMVIRFMELFSVKKYDFTRLSELLGLCYQICDDYRNLQSADYMKTKSYCEDFTEGKFSFPIMHAIRTRPEDNRVMNILRQRTRDVEVKKYGVSLLEEFGSFEYTRNVLNKLRQELQEEVQKLGGNPYMEEVFSMFFQFCEK